jgi:type II secretory pathway component PulK
MPVGAGMTEKSWSILASPITVPIELPAAAAVSLSSDDDQHQVVWVRPNGSGFEAIGSYSGVITRETKNPCDAACQQQKQARIFEMFSKIMANSHEMKKALIGNLPR